MFAVVEQKEPHAGRMAFAAIEQPATFAARCELARRIRDELEVPLPIWVDGMDDASRALFSDLPSPAFVIDRDGRIADKLPWAEAGLLQDSIARVLGKVSVSSPAGSVDSGTRTAAQCKEEALPATLLCQPRRGAMRASHITTFLLAGLGACTTTRHESRSMAEAAFQQLAGHRWEWDGDGIPEDVEALQKGEVSFADAEAVLLDYGHDGYLFVCHFGWSVAICALDQELKVRDVRTWHAKLGFSIVGNNVVTLHEHPGTGMFYDTTLHVWVAAGKPVVSEASDTEVDDAVRDR